jgi:quercetin dioxygenase-like cupin family protein
MSQLPPRFISAGEGITLDVQGSYVTTKVSAADTANTITTVEIRAEPGVGVPFHTHTREDETFVILEGEVEFQVAGKTWIAKPGDVVFGPRGTSHQWFAQTSCCMMLMITPGQALETMFERLAALPPGQPDMAVMLGICADAGISFP